MSQTSAFRVLVKLKLRPEVVAASDICIWLSLFSSLRRGYMAHTFFMAANRGFRAFLCSLKPKVMRWFSMPSAARGRKRTEPPALLKYVFALPVRNVCRLMILLIVMPDGGTTFTVVVSLSSPATKV